MCLEHFLAIRMPSIREEEQGLSEDCTRKNISLASLGKQDELLFNVKKGANQDRVTINLLADHSNSKVTKHAFPSIVVAI